MSDYISSRVKQLRKEREEKEKKTSVSASSSNQKEVQKTESNDNSDYIAKRVQTLRQEREKPSVKAGTLAAESQQRVESTSSPQPGGLLPSLLSLMQRSTELQNQTTYRNREIMNEADAGLGRALANAITPDDPVQALTRSQRSTGLRTVPAAQREQIVQSTLNRDGTDDQEIEAAKNQTPEALYNEYNTWLEQGDNREVLSAIINAEQAARRVPSDQVDQYIMNALLDQGYTADQVREVQNRRSEYEKSVPFGYDITHRIGSSIEGIGSDAVGSALMALPVFSQALDDILFTGQKTSPEDIDDLAGQIYQLGKSIYGSGQENLQESRLGLNDLQDLAYGAAESAGENIALGLLSPGLALGEQTARAAGAGISDMADAGRSSGAAALSALGHGAISYGIEQLGIGQMMRNMGMRTGMAPAVDAALDRIASLPGMNRLPTALAGTIANAGEEATEEFVQSYADTALDTLLGAPNTPGLLSGELLNEALQSAAGGAAGGALIGGISGAIGQARMSQRFQPRADEVANNQLTAAIQQAGQTGQMQQAAAMNAIQDQTEVTTEMGTAAQNTETAAKETLQPKAVDSMLDSLVNESGGRLDSSVWDLLTSEPQKQTAQQETQQTARERYQEQHRAERIAARQAWDETQHQEARLMAENTTMSEAAVNTAVEAMPADVSGEVYALASNSMYQLARQGLTENADEALDLASRSGVRVNQILAAPGGAEALQQVFNQGLIEGLQESGYGQAGLADASRAGTAEYADNALIPDEDRALIDLFAAASDTAVTVSQKLENDAGGYVDTALGQVFFGAEAGADTFGTILHESNHWYNAWDEAGGRELQTELLKYQAQQMGFESVDELAQQYIQEYQQAGEPLTYAQACEEITSDALRGVFDTEESFKRWVNHQKSLAQQNAGQRSTLQKVMDSVRDLLDKIISKAKSILSRTPDNAAAKQAQNLAESQKRILEDLYYKHAEAAMEAERNARAANENVESANENVGSTNKRYHISMESESQKIRRQIEGYDAQIESLKVEREEVKKQKEEWEASEEVERFKEKEKEAKKHGLFSAEFKAFKETEEYKNWVKKRKSFNSKIVEIDHTIELLRTQVAELGSNAAKSKKSNDAELQIKYDAMAAQNGGKAEYRRKLAKEKFGTTENFYQAGYVLPDGSMLNFAQNADTRDSDHREIIDVFGPAEVKIGTDAMNQFIADGNVRVMAESPGIDISANTKPTAQQLNKIRDMAETLGADKKRFMLDISDENGKVVASKTYSGRINADKVVREISEYYRSGKLPAESDLAQFRYQLPVDQDQAESGQRAAAWENIDREGVAEALAEAFSLSETQRVPVERIQKMARDFLHGEQSKANEITIAKQMQGLLNYMSSDNADYNTAIAAAEGIADGIMQRSGRIDKSLWNEYKDLHYFTVGVKRGGPEYQELVYRYGSYALAKKELARFGITVTTSEKAEVRGIDQVYQELAGDYPGLFSAEITGSMEQLDRIAEVREAIKPQWVNSYGETYEEAKADLALRIIGRAVSEGVTDTGLSGMIRQRIDQNLNSHRVAVQDRVVKALNAQERQARNEAYKQAQRVVNASAQANRERAAREAQAWAKSDARLRTSLARSQDTVQRARDARSADSLRRAIAANRAKLNRMLLHPSEQYHVPPQLMRDALQIAELANASTYLKTQLEASASADDGVDSVSEDWKNSGISEMLADLSSSMERQRQRSARLTERADTQARRLEQGLNRLYDLQGAQEEWYADYKLGGGKRLDHLTVDQLTTLRDLSSAMVTVIQNSNKLMATETGLAASEFGAEAKREVETSPSRLQDQSGRLSGAREKLLEFYNKYRANVYNAERYFNMLGGHRHGGAMEKLGQTLSAGEAKQTAIREKGMQIFRDVLDGDQNQKLLKRFSGPDAELIDVGLDTKINWAQMVSLYMHLKNPQNINHVLKGGLVIPNMEEYAKGNMEKAFRTNQTVRIRDGEGGAEYLVSKIQEKLEDGEMGEYSKKWVSHLEELLNNYTKNVINETSRKLSGYDKAKVENYYPLAVDRDVLQKEIEGVVHNGTIEGRGFLKARQEKAAAPVLLEEATNVMARTLSDAAAYGGLAPAIRDANKIWNANRQEEGSLRAAVRKNFGQDGVSFVENYLADLQQQPRGRKNIFDFLSGLRGRYASAVLTLNAGVALGQVSGVATAASELGWKATWNAYREMLPNSAEHKEAIRKEMMDHGYWQLEAGISQGATAELNAARNRQGKVQRLLSKIPDWLENMDTKTRMALWEGSKYFVDHHLEELGLPADAHGSDAWWDAVVNKMTEVNNRSQPNFTVSQQAALQRDPSQLVKMLTMFRSQGFQNYGLVASAVEDLRAQTAYEQEYAQQAEDSSLGEKAQAAARENLNKVRQAKQNASKTLKLAVGGQLVSAAIFVAAKILVDDWIFHRYDREKDEEGRITPFSVAGRAAGMIADNLMGNVYLLSEVWNTIANLFGSGDEEPVSLTGVDAISDFAGDLNRLQAAFTKGEIDPAKVADRLVDLAGSMGNLVGLPVARLTKMVEGLTGWGKDLATAATSDGLTLGDILNAPTSSTVQYDDLYTAVFEEPDPDDVAAAMEQLRRLDELNPPSKESNAKAGDSKVLTELLKREKEYGGMVQEAAQARLEGNESHQRAVRQKLVNTLADALGINKNTKEGQRRLSTVIDKVDNAISGLVKAGLGADSKTGTTIYTNLFNEMDAGGDVRSAQDTLRKAGFDDDAIKNAVRDQYKQSYLEADDTTRRNIETKLTRLTGADGEPYFAGEDLQDWVMDYELKGTNDSVYTDLDEALQTQNQAAAQQQINRYMDAGKSSTSIKDRISKLYKEAYQAADAAGRQELSKFLMSLRGTDGKQLITMQTILNWAKGQ